MDVHDFIGSLPAAFLECRELGHLWRPFRAALSAEGNSYERTLRCARCKTQRVQELSMRGHVVSNRYVYPDGYESPKGTGRLIGDDRDELRMASLTNYLGKGTS